MMHDLTDGQWAVIQPLLPPPHTRGRPRADDRKTLKGILSVLRTGCAWEDMPRCYGSPIPCWRRLRKWQEEGVWEGIGRVLLASLDEQGRLAWQRAFLDGTSVAAKKGAKLWGWSSVARTAS
jgi:transposase